MKLDKSFCFMFLSVFGLGAGEDNQSNLSIKLCATNLRTRAKRKNKRLYTVMVNSISLATTLFSLLKFFRFHKQSLGYGQLTEANT